MSYTSSQVWVVDFGSQYTQLIIRKTRALKYSVQLLTCDQALALFDEGARPKALVLSGGPQSVFEDQTPFEKFLSDKKLPILGICYGMQILSHYLGGKVERGKQGEYGIAEVHLDKKLKTKIDKNHLNVWMSHFDHVTEVSDEFDIVMKSSNGIIAGIEHKKRPIFGIQFHPEVSHTERGSELLNYFYEDIAELKHDWTSEKLLQDCYKVVEETKGKKVLCAFSGGIDSLVAATLTSQVIGKDLHCFFIDNGLLRPQDYHHIAELEKKIKLNITIVSAQHEFLEALKGVSEPEQKRKIIGRVFIEVFDAQVKKSGIKFDYLLQGTLFPDVIESISPHKVGGKSVTIKSHHNVGGLPAKMNLKLLEPLRYLFKDEVRQLGEMLELDKTYVYRHPFPGPGIGIRVLGELTAPAILKVQHSDQILYEELVRRGMYDRCWQAFTVLLPVKTVGVKGDARVYEEVISLRLVTSVDGMTADACDFPVNFLKYISNRIVNEVPGITRVVYDLTSKPPGTIEWE